MDVDHDTRQLSPEFARSIRTAIGKALDYICDVISCSPEQLRLPKTLASIEQDEEGSRLTSPYYGAEDKVDNMEYSLLLWNDEKHTIEDVEHQVARACKQRRAFGKARAEETDFMGRSIVKYSSNIPQLLSVSKIVEQIKVTTTIRSARDTYREQMCGTIIEWLEDISGCSVGDDHNILRMTVCEELLGVWRVGSKASNTQVGKAGIDDHALEEEKEGFFVSHRIVVPVEATVIDMDVDADPAEDGDQGDESDGQEDLEADDYEEGQDNDDAHSDEDDVDMVGNGNADSEDGDDETNHQEIVSIHELIQAASERHNLPVDLGILQSNNDSEDDEDGSLRIPNTPHIPAGIRPAPPTPSHWIEKPAGCNPRPGLPPHEDLRKRVRLDWLIMFDLRLWKKARTDLRDLYISTVIAIPEFKRILGLRFAGLYTALSELYLIADREPDHSIINLSLQMLTTPTITAEVVQRGNFLTNLMAILYTFLTTRQVSRPALVNREATLAFDGASVTNPLTNRRMFHFFHDLKYLLASAYVQKLVRDEPRYAMQFLDLVRLHQGICPNVRAISEHVEFEADAWVSAAMITREINRLVRQFADAFKLPGHRFDDTLFRVIKTTSKYATVASMGWETYRATQTEMKSPTTFKRAGGYVIDSDRWGEPNTYKVIRFSVDKDPISFHHALHYTLSWLIEAGKAMPAEQLRKVLLLKAEDINGDAPSSADSYEPEDLMLAMFDMPLRVCVWLGQQKTNMWVRNGFSLRHQTQSYRGVLHRELTHQRDIFLLQAAMVTINPSRMLVNMIDRFNLHACMNGNFEAPEGYEKSQILDLAEEFLHLLVVILSDRFALIPLDEEPDIQRLRIRREIIHVLCFKSMQFSELTRMLPDRLQEHPAFQDVLSSLTNYRPPDGLSDYGTFELRPEFLDEVDPYIVQFSKNQREETEANYRARAAKKTGQQECDVAFVPQLRPIKTGTFSGLANFTSTPVFAQIIHSSLAYALGVPETATGGTDVRTETFVQLCLHLCQLAVLEDKSGEQRLETNSFILNALHKHAPGGPPSAAHSTAPSDSRLHDDRNTIATLLCHVNNKESLKACRAKATHILRSMRQKHPVAFDSVAMLAAALGDRLEVDDGDTKKAEAERKKLLAKERQAKAMAQMKLQQQAFMNTSGLDFEEDDFSDSDSVHHEEHHTQWKYPTGTCILCQEEMNESKLYGTLAFVTESRILRETSPRDPDYLYEVVTTPENLDRSAQDIRPFGVASMNTQTYKKISADGAEVTVERQGLGRGFPPAFTRGGPVAVGCSHLMHYSCFDLYYDSARRRQPNQIARHHPENLEKKEFVCPLCKALGNAFLPIIWKSKQETTCHALAPANSFHDWLRELGPSVSRLQKAVDGGENSVSKCQDLFLEYAKAHIVAPISNDIHQPTAKSPGPAFSLNLGSWGTGSTGTTPTPLPASIPDMFRSSQSLLARRNTNQKPYDELYTAYERLRDTYRQNGIPASYSTPSRLWDANSAELTACDALAKTLGFSISAVEIAQRGIASDVGSTLLDRISSQTLAHLRIFSETVSSYFAVGILKGGEMTKTTSQFKEMQEGQVNKLLIGHHEIFDDEMQSKVASDTEPLLASDTFVFLAETAVCAIPAMGWDPINVARLCYIAELVKAIIVIEDDCDLPGCLQQWERVERLGFLEGRIAYTEHQLDLLQRFAKFVGSSMGASEAFAELSSFSLAVFRHLVRAYATPFLRKTVILLHTRFGIQFPPGDFAESDRTEEERLSKSLKMFSLDKIFESVLSDTAEGEYLRGIITGWCRHVVRRKSKVSIAHPAIFELVGLPRNYDVLIEEAMKQRCPTTGKDIVDPNICLFCGSIFCGQAVCCRDPVHKEGGCNQHLAK